MSNTIDVDKLDKIETFLCVDGLTNDDLVNDLNAAGLVHVARVVSQLPTDVKVNCYGHMDPEKGYYTQEYVVVHPVPLPRAIALLEEMSREDWEDGPRCLAEITLEVDSQ